jgi:transcriptional regulator with XRE-family HTH domain
VEWWGSRPFTAGVEDNRGGVYGEALVALTIESAAMAKMPLASISRGMLSKIENGQTSASLSTLTKVARALGVTLSTMFSNYDGPVVRPPTDAASRFVRSMI